MSLAFKSTASLLAFALSSNPPTDSLAPPNLLDIDRQAMDTAQTSSSAHSSTAPSPASGPASVQQLHHPNAMAHVEVPKGVENIPQGMSVMGGSALLAKKMAASGSVSLLATPRARMLIQSEDSSSFYSPTDTLVSPCTQKLHLQKGKRWANVKQAASVRCITPR